jgi:hypothetical protein
MKKTVIPLSELRCKYLSKEICQMYDANNVGMKGGKGETGGNKLLIWFV